MLWCRIFMCALYHLVNVESTSTSSSTVHKTKTKCQVQAQDRQMTLFSYLQLSPMGRVTMVHEPFYCFVMNLGMFLRAVVMSWRRIGRVPRICVGVCQYHDSGIYECIFHLTFFSNNLMTVFLYVFVLPHVSPYVSVFYSINNHWILMYYYY